ncbi:MAG: hypothetical protein CVU97_06330 [Firmicutes bacterium HGW-Firmicutes-21]|nr:MAG: hypothetical protein CVU97_06330 [Firmicutes bacterium HGW-Firmicutes-21]
MTPNDLDNLIVDVSTGKPGALEALYIETKAAIFGLAFSILRDYSIAEDIGMPPKICTSCNVSKEMIN